MAKSVQLKKLTHRHEAILHFMMSSPGVAKWEIAAKFNVTQSWLSCVINSDAFQEELALHTDIAFHETVLPLRKRMLALADKTIDRLNQLIPIETSLDVVRKTADSVLQAAGYGSPSVGEGGVHNTQNNYFLGNASAEVLARARDRIGKGETYESDEHLQLANPEGRDEGKPAKVEAADSPMGSGGNGAPPPVRRWPRPRRRSRSR